MLTVRPALGHGGTAKTGREGESTQGSSIPSPLTVPLAGTTHAGKPTGQREVQNKGKGKKPRMNKLKLSD